MISRVVNQQFLPIEEMGRGTMRSMVEGTAKPSLRFPPLHPASRGPPPLSYAQGRI